MKIAHISDLHFGCIEPEVLAALSAALSNQAPDLIIASGDITQSATVAEFEQARDWFATLTPPVLSIPGNHDLPGMDLSRFVSPFGRYKSHISPDLDPEFRSDLVHVKGINSARMIMPHWNWANGGVSHAQRQATREAYAQTKAPWRVFALHHPLVSARELPLDVFLSGRRATLNMIRQQKVDIVLAGHQHHAFIEPVAEDGHTTIFLNASTSTSKRLRKQPNGYNLLSFGEKTLRIDMMRFANGGFSTFEALTHTK